MAAPPADLVSLLTGSTDFDSPGSFLGAGAQGFLLRPEEGRFLDPSFFDSLPAPDFGGRDLRSGSDIFNSLVSSEPDPVDNSELLNGLGQAAGGIINAPPVRDFIEGSIEDVVDRVNELQDTNQDGGAPSGGNTTPLIPPVDTSGAPVNPPEGQVTIEEGVAPPENNVLQGPPEGLSEAPSAGDILGFLADPVSSLTDAALGVGRAAGSRVLNGITSIFEGGSDVASTTASTASAAAPSAAPVAEGPSSIPGITPPDIDTIDVAPSASEQALSHIGGSPLGVALNAGAAFLSGFLADGSTGSRIGRGLGSFLGGPFSPITAEIGGAIGANARDRDDRLAAAYDPQDRAIFDSEGTLVSLVPQDVTELDPVPGYDGQYLVPGASLDGHPLVTDQEGNLRSIDNNGHLTSPIVNVNEGTRPIRLQLDGQSVTNTRGGGIGRFDPQAGAMVTLPGPPPQIPGLEEIAEGVQTPQASSHLAGVNTPGQMPVDTTPLSIEEQVQADLEALGTAVPADRLASAGLAGPSINRGSMGEPPSDIEVLDSVSPLPSINSPFADVLGGF